MRAWMSVVLVMFVMVLGGCRRNQEASPPPQTAPVVPQITSTDEANNIEIFKRDSPSTVFITNNQLRRDLLTLDVFEIPQGSGSGFVWNQAGYIVTNAHVVEGAGSIVVGLENHASYQAKVVGVAPSIDIAVLHIDAPASQLKPLPLGNSNKLQVGQKVLAIGNPFGLDYSLTTGIISALGREISAPNGRRIRDVIQTDAAINPGNSGGPLLDSSGRLIGVNAAIIGPGGGSSGVGFAIPVNSVAKAVPQLIQYGRVIRPVLGVNIVKEQITRKLGITGAVVLSVVPGLGAQKAGITGLRRAPDGHIIVGDVIVAFDRFPIKDADDLLNALEQFKPGDKVTVKTRRDGQSKTFQVTLTTPQ